MGHSTTRKVLKGHGLITSCYVCIPNHLPLTPNRSRTRELDFPTIWELWVAGGVPVSSWVILDFYHILRARCLVCVLSCILFFVISWTVTARFLSMEFSRQQYWVDYHFLLQGIFLTQGWNPRLLWLLHWQVGSLPLAPPGKPRKLLNCNLIHTEVIWAF